MTKKMLLIATCSVATVLNAGTPKQTPKPTAKPTAKTASLPSQAVIPTTIANSLADCAGGFGPPGPGEYDVVITFSGIGVFERQDASGYINVRMPNVITGRPAIPDPVNPQLELRSEVQAHSAYVLSDVNAESLMIYADEALQPAFFEGNCYNYHSLRGDTITVSEANAPMDINKPLCFTDAHDGKYCPDAATVGSMYWIPSIARILGTSQTKKTELFSDPPNPTYTSGVVHVDRGYLETVVTNPTVWSFKIHKKDSHSLLQNIAQEVRWHIRGKGSPFVLELTRGGTKKLLPFVVPIGKPLSIFIANSPVDQTGPIRQPMGMDTDMDFRLYYEFIYKFDLTKGPIPFSAAADYQCHPDQGDLDPGTPTLQTCSTMCPILDPNCEKKVLGNPLPSGLNCGDTQWP
jgi:hypothetical protein